MSAIWCMHHLHGGDDATTQLRRVLERVGLHHEQAGQGLGELLPVDATAGGARCMAAA
jgi:hypothetical protein